MRTSFGLEDQFECAEFLDEGIGGGLVETLVGRKGIVMGAEVLI